MLLYKGNSYTSINISCIDLSETVIGDVLKSCLLTFWQPIEELSRQIYEYNDSLKKLKRGEVPLRLSTVLLTVIYVLLFLN